MLNEIYLGFILAILLGALIGAQREMRQQKLRQRDFAGFRTFTFISILGLIGGFLSFEIFNNIYVMLSMLWFIIIISSISYYVVYKENHRKIGITSQVVAIITFFIGVMISLKLYQISIGIAILVTTILALGTKLHYFAKKIQNAEAYATLKFAIISLVILPLLPKDDYTPLDLPIIGSILEGQEMISQDLLLSLDVFNFYHIWLMVVFISGIAYIGYILMRTIGAQRGILITGFLGGFMSSTALTSSFSIESKRYPKLSLPLAIGVIIACSTMFFRVIFEAMVINPDLVLGIVSVLGVMGLSGFLLVGYLIHKNNNTDHIKSMKIESPFSLGPAFKFALIFFFVSFFSKLLSVLYGDQGIYLLSFISGISDVDAITISLLTLAKENSISALSAQMGIVIAAISNTLFKGGIAYYLGSHNFSQKIIYAFSIILLLGGISILV